MSVILQKLKAAKTYLLTGKREIAIGMAASITPLVLGFIGGRMVGQSEAKFIPVDRVVINTVFKQTPCLIGESRPRHFTNIKAITKDGVTLAFNLNAFVRDEAHKWNETADVSDAALEHIAAATAQAIISRKTLKQLDSQDNLRRTAKTLSMAPQMKNQPYTMAIYLPPTATAEWNEEFSNRTGIAMLNALKNPQDPASLRLNAFPNDAFGMTFENGQATLTLPRREIKSIAAGHKPKN